MGVVTEVTGPRVDDKHVRGAPLHLWDQRVPMRDGVTLSADVYLPAAGVEGGPYPAILVRTPYNNQHATYRKHAVVYARHGYATVLQDCRGRLDSEGSFYPWLYEGPDGYDTVEWLAAQPWCTGKVGMIGGSYDGATQWAAAREHPPHLTTIVPNCTGSGLHLQEAPYSYGMIAMFMFVWLIHLQGGRVMLDPGLVDWQEVMWHLPLREMDQRVGRPSQSWQDWLDHPVLDEYWLLSQLTNADFARLDLPVLHLTGWRDGDQASALTLFMGMKRHSPAADHQHLIIGPWGHGAHWTSAAMAAAGMRPGGTDFPSAGFKGIEDIELPWFDHWLKGESSPAFERWLKGASATTDSPACLYFVNGPNEWRATDTWPPPEVNSALTLYLHSSGHANTSRGNGRLLSEMPAEAAIDVLTYDPADPAPSVIGWEGFDPIRARNDGAAGALIMDMRALERRPDVLVFTSKPLSEPVTVLGKPSLTFYGSSDCRDTDWVVYVADVVPGGRSLHLAGGLPGSGLLRARYRTSVTEEELLEPGAIYDFTIEFMAICHTFEAGHRIRVSITSSAFPFFDRNTNTGNPIGQDREFLIAHNSVYHSPDRLSYLGLPVLSAESSDGATLTSDASVIGESRPQQGTGGLR